MTAGPPSPPALAAAAPADDPPPVDLRSRAARGTLVNTAFMIGVSAITLVQGMVVARLLTTDAYGTWGLIMAGFMTLLMLAGVGIDDKFIQQDERDQRRAFEIAFTLQLALMPVFVVITLVGMPLFALLYGQPEVGLIGAVLALGMPAIALQAPLWIHYRRMDFLRQRVLQTIDPVMTFVITIALALAGLEVWALVIGALAGTWIASLAIVATSPYRMRLRWDGDAMRQYRSFSVPLFVSSFSTVLLVQAPVIVGARVLGLTAIAGIALANSISMFTTRVESLVTQSMYPAICRVQDRRDLLYEAFWKSNRFALLWAAPLGVALTLFAGDFVRFVIGEKWRFAVPLIAIYGANAVLNQIGFNWTAFFRAVGDTRPIAVVTIVQLIAVLGLAVPLLAFEGLTAFGVGLGIATTISVVARWLCLRRLFGGRPLAVHVLRACMPTAPATLAVLALRELIPSDRTAARVVLEVALFAALVVAVTVASERRLLFEALRYVRRPRPQQAAS